MCAPCGQVTDAGLDPVSPRLLGVRVDKNVSRLGSLMTLNDNFIFMLFISKEICILKSNISKKTHSRRSTLLVLLG